MNFEERRIDAMKEFEATCKLLDISEGDTIKVMLRGAPFGPGMGGDGMPTSIPQFFSGQLIGHDYGVFAIRFSTPDGSMMRMSFPVADVYIAIPSQIASS